MLVAMDVVETLFMRSPYLTLLNRIAFAIMLLSILYLFLVAVELKLEGSDQILITIRKRQGLK